MSEGRREDGKWVAKQGAWGKPAEETKRTRDKIRVMERGAWGGGGSREKEVGEELNHPPPTVSGHLTAVKKNEISICLREEMVKRGGGKNQCFL